jgi:hypothetical protein
MGDMGDMVVVVVVVFQAMMLMMMMCTQFTVLSRWLLCVYAIATCDYSLIITPEYLCNLGCVCLWCVYLFFINI